MLLVGAGLLLIVGFDALSATLSIGAAAGPLTSRLGPGWWRMARRLAARPDPPIIVSTGPVVVLTIAEGKHPWTNEWTAPMATENTDENRQRCSTT